MVGRLEAGGRIAAAALLALGSLAPLNGPLLAASVAPVADTSIACAVTVGTADTATADTAPVVTDLEGDSNATDGGGADGSGADGTASTGSDGSGSTTAAG